MEVKERNIGAIKAQFKDLKIERNVQQSLDTLIDTKERIPGSKRVHATTISS